VARWKKLKGVAHNFSHHCQSGLSYIQPHISNELEKIKKKTSTFILFPEFKTTLDLNISNPLYLALNSSISKFYNILELNGFDLSEIKSVEIQISIQKYGNWDSSVNTIIETVDGHIIEGFADYIIH